MSQHSVSDYVSFSDFKSLSHNFKNGQEILALHVNSCSLSNKMDELGEFITELNCIADLLCITETWFQDDFHINLQGYECVSIGRPCPRLGGGVAIYVLSGISYNVLQMFSGIMSDIELITLESTNFLISNIYRPPKGNINNFLDFLTGLLDFSRTCGKPCIVLGDFNIDIKSGNNSSILLSNLFLSYDFQNTIGIPTRITDHSASIIDLCYTNSGSFFSGVFDHSFSDHLPIFILFKLTQLPHSSINHRAFSYRKITNSSIHDCKLALMDEPWTNVLGNSCPNNALDNFIKIFKTYYDDFFPLRQGKIRARFRKPWMSNSLLRRIRKRNRLFARFLRSKDASELCEFKLYRNNLSKDLKIAKRNYYSQLFNTFDKKNSWKVINELLGRRSNGGNVTSLIHDNVRVTNPLTIANLFNDYFINLPRALTCHLPPNNDNFHQYLVGGNSNSFYLFPIELSELMLTFSSINISKSSGCDSFSPLVIKSVANAIAMPLLHIFNLILETSIFPDYFKMSRVIVIHKKGPRDDIANYRPVCLISIFAKIFEKLICTRLTNYMEVMRLLHPKQFGFRKGKSTELCLLHIIKLLHSNFDNKLTTVGIFCDLSRAFDTIDHRILLRKLDYYGIRGSELAVFTSYLSHRSQYVFIDGRHSVSNFTYCGVPQGSVLGPLLFLIYMNDIFNVVKECSMFLFADDTSIFFSGNDLPLLNFNINLAMKKIEKWFSDNYLTLNTNKTNYMVFSKRRQPFNFSINLSSVSLDEVKEIKFLGIWLDKNLKWDYHTTSVSNKISRFLGLISRFSSFVSSSSMLAMYYSFIYPHLIYGILLWGNSSNSNLEKIFLLQKRFLRLLSDSSTGCRETAVKFSILPIHNLFKYHLLNFMFRRIKHGLNQDILSINFPTHSHNTRQNHHIYIPRFRTSLASRSFFISGPRFWNNLPVTLRNLSSFNIFKKRLKHDLSWL